MPLSLKCQIDKLEHKGQITKEEHKELLKKLDGHDKQIRADAIDEFVEKMKTEPFSEYVMDIVYHWQNKLKEQTE